MKCLEILSSLKQAFSFFGLLLFIQMGLEGFLDFVELLFELLVLGLEVLDDLVAVIGEGLRDEKWCGDKLVLH